jgi:hypothetical protein
MKFLVQTSYTITVIVDAQDKEGAIMSALDIDHNFVDVNGTGAILEISEEEDCIVIKS